MRKYESFTCNIMFDYGFLQYVHVSWKLALQPVQDLRHRPLRHSLGLVHHLVQEKVATF